MTSNGEKGRAGCTIVILVLLIVIWLTSGDSIAYQKCKGHIQSLSFQELIFSNMEVSSPLNDLGIMVMYFEVRENGGPLADFRTRCKLRYNGGDKENEDNWEVLEVR